MKLLTTKPFIWIESYLPPLLWAALIYILSNQSVIPGFEQSVPDFILKKTGHMTVYFVLYWMLYRGIKQTISFKNHLGYILVPLFICFIYAASDELHQGFVPGRYPTARDVGYDMLGASVALLRKTNCI
jgi:VanZ family protein